MNTNELIKQIETLAASENISFIEACKAFQAAAAKLNNETLITKIHFIKMARYNQK
jgi:predicted transposase YbfD/YdcC